MTEHTLADAAYCRDLGDGLVLRWSTPEDAERLAELFSFVFRPKADTPINERMMAWTRNNVQGNSPLLTSGDYALVEDTRTGKAVAGTCLLAQAWDYDGITVPIGRPETVATLPEYRNRGLIRAIFELIHARSAAKGHLVQAITGIAYYYRQFGYEYALDLSGGRSIALSAIAERKEGDAEPYTLRDATPDDIPHVLALYNRERQRSMVSTPLDAAYLRHTMSEAMVESGEGWRTLMIVDAEHAPRGYVMRRHRRWGDSLAMISLAVDSGTSLAAALPSLLRALKQQTLATPVWPHHPDVPAAKISFAFGREHPIYVLLDDRLTPGRAQPYAYYVRVPDLPRFIRHIAPALEQRLSASVFAGHTGELKLDFYRGGLRLAFEHGRLSVAEDWRNPTIFENDEGGGNAGFPPLVFGQLLWGHRSLADLRAAFADVWANDDVRPLLETLFPARMSWALALD